MSTELLASLCMVLGGGLEVGVTTGCGGRTVLLRAAGGGNLLHAQPEKWAEQAANAVMPPLEAPWVQDAGQIVWLGPQSRSWADQSVSHEAEVSARGWPPDPILTLAPYEKIEHTRDRLVLRSPHSPVSQITVTKTWTATRDGSIRFEAEAKNTGVRPVRKGLWFNLRALATARVYVPVAAEGSVRRSGDAGVPVRFLDGFVEIGLPTLKTGQERADEKFFVEPSCGMIAAAVPGGFLVLEFAPTASGKVAEGQAPVEIYRLAERDGPGLLELEQHGPACDLGPGETMRHAETWRFVPWAEAEQLKSSASGFLGEWRAELRN